MPTTTTACPSCRRQVRLPEGVVGRRVQCPACQETFVAAAEAPPVHAEAPLAAEKAETTPSHALRLALDEDGPARRVLKVPPPPGPLQPVVLESADDAGPRFPNALRPCPYCKERIPANAPYCRFCGEDLHDDRPEWERPGAVRRDCEPHRGGTVLVIGIIGLCLSFPHILSVIGLPLSITAIVMANHDVRRMEAGEMDPQGLANTRGGRICGIIGTVIGLLWFAVFGLAILSIVMH